MHAIFLRIIFAKVRVSINKNKDKQSLCKPDRISGVIKTILGKM